MLVLRLLVMVLTIICLMDGHAEVSSSTMGMKNGGKSPAVIQNDPEVQNLDRKKKKKPKPGKKKKPKPAKKKTKPSKAKPKPTKPDTTTPTISTITLKATTITTTATTTTTTTVLPITTVTTAKTTTSTASATSTLSTTTSSTTTAKTTTATSSTVSTTTTTILTTATTTFPATTADSGAGGECKATNGKPCIFPYKDGNEEYNECKNEGGKYFWCATSVYDSGKYKHWSYCSTEGSCPLEGDGECRAANNKPCVFPFKDGNKEYNECADYGGKYFWCATGTNSAGKYTAWSECPKDGSCPLSGQGTTLVMTSTATTALTTPSTNDTSAAASAIANVENALTEINDTLQNLETAGFSEDEKHLLETMNDLSEYLESGSPTRNWNFYDAVKINSMTQQLYSSTANIKASKQVNPGFKSAHQSADATCSIKVKNAKLSKVNAGPGRMFQLHTISEILGIITNVPSSSACCAECKILAADTELFEHSSYQKQCDCYKTKLGVPPQTMASANLDSGVCLEEGTCQLTRGLNCPNGYKDNGKSPMEFKELLLPVGTVIDDREKCGQACKTHSSGKCIALIWICAETKCQLFADKDEATTTPIKKNNYCLDLKYSNDCPKDLKKPAENLMCKCLPTLSALIDTLFCYEGNYCLRTTRSSKCLPDCKKVSDSDSYKECVCNKEICSDGWYCDTSTEPNKCVPGNNWHTRHQIIVTKNKGDSCDKICHSQGKGACDKDAIKSITTNKGCLDLLIHFSNKQCKLCSGESTDTNCFPGSDSKFVYYHASYSELGNGFKCDTVPGSRITDIACPCLPDCDLIRDNINRPKSNACMCNGKRCKDGTYCYKDFNNNYQCVEGKCDSLWLSTYRGYRPDQKKRSVLRLVGGTRVQDTKRWPWIAWLKMKIGETKPLFGPPKPKYAHCTGAVISCQYVITALHCLTNLEDAAEKNLNEIKTFQTDDIEIFLKTTEKYKGTRFTVKKIYVRRDASGKIEFSKKIIPGGKLKYELLHDVAIVLLNRVINPYKMTDEGIRPIMLPIKPMVKPEFIPFTQPFWIAGFGKILGSKGTIINTQYLHELERDTLPFPLKSKKHILMQLGTENSAICGGDSGGPGMIEEQDKWYLTSLSMKSPEICNKNEPFQNDHVEHLVNVYYYPDLQEKNQNYLAYGMALSTFT